MSLTAYQTMIALLSVLPAAKPEPPLPVPPAPVDLPPGAVVRYGSTNFRDQERLTDVSYTPDGRTLVTGTAPEGNGNGHLVFWNTATGTKRFESEPQPGPVIQVTCSPDGRTVGVLHQGKNQVSIYDATNGKLLRHVGQRTFGQPAFSADGKLVGSPVREGICLWDVDTGDEVQRLEMQEGMGQVRWVMFSPKGRRLASVGPERSLRVWDLDSGEVLFQVDDIEGRWSYVDFSPDGTMVGMMTGESLILWDTVDGHEIRRYPTDADGQGFAITPDGKTLILVARTTGETREVESGKRLHHFAIGSTGRLPSWSVTPDGRTLAVVCGCVVNQWDVKTGENKNVSAGHRFPITAVAVARDGKSVITQDSAGGVRIWEPTTGRELRKLQAPKDAADRSRRTAGRRISAASRKTASCDSWKWRRARSAAGSRTSAASGGRWPRRPTAPCWRCSWSMAKACRKWEFGRRPPGGRGKGSKRCPRNCRRSPYPPTARGSLG